VGELYVPEFLIVALNGILGKLLVESVMVKTPTYSLPDNPQIFAPVIEVSNTSCPSFDRTLIEISVEILFGT